MKTAWILVPVFIIGCGPKEMGAKAPAFGSSAKVSTTAGFIEGRWLRKIDRSNIAPGSPDLSGMLPRAFLEFKADHTCTFDCEHHLVHMTWKEVPSGVSLKAIDVDGEDPAKLDAEFKKSMDSGFFARSDARTMGRASALIFATLINKLELMPDKKRMIEADESGTATTGSKMFGDETWVRLES